MPKMICRTFNDEAPECVSNCGDKVREVFKLVHEPDGNTHVEKVDEIDIVKEINSYAESCDMQRIIQRFNMTGQACVPDGQGMYIDATDVPQNPQEAMDWIKDHPVPAQPSQPVEPVSVANNLESEVNSDAHS